MRYTHGGDTREAVEAEWDQRLGGRSDVRRGLGYWIGLHEDRPVGWWGLGAYSDSSDGNFGFRLLQESWGKGLGTEGGVALVQHGFVTARLPRICAGTEVDNAASRRALVKIGFREVPAGRLDVQRSTRVRYQALRANWLD